MTLEAPPAREPGLSRRTADCAIALLLLGLAGMVLWDSFGRGAGWSPEGPQTGYFPARVGIILLIASVFVLVSAFRHPDAVFITWSQLAMVSRVAIPLVLYVLAIEFLGIYVASALFLAVFMITLSDFRWWTVLASSILIPLVFFLVFEIQFLVPLPKGPLEAALGY